MPEKSRERRTLIGRRQGRATAIKSSDVGKAKGLSAHAAKKSSHVEGMRTPKSRSASRSKAATTAPNSEVDRIAGLGPSAGRVPGANRKRPVQRKISNRSRAVAAKTARKKK